MQEFSLKHHLFQSKLGPWLRLMRFDRPIGLLLLLWPTAWALVVAAGGWPSWKNVVIFVTGVVVMRSAGCVINDYFDRDIDPLVSRTQTRPLASGEIKPPHALALFIGLMIVALGLVMMTNRLTIGLAFVGALLATTYPLFKRITHFPQLVLGLAFAWSIPMAFAAEVGHVPAVAWWWLWINILWVLVYDTEYAMADRPDDLKVGVKSTAIALGRWDRVGIGVCMGFMLLSLAGLGIWMMPSLVWFVSILVVAGLFFAQLIRISKRDPASCFDAFLSNHWVGLVIFIGLLLHHLF